MEPSPACFDLIKRFEGCRLTAYRCPAGVWTCGWGHTAGVKPGHVLTQEQADSQLAEDVEQFARFVEASFAATIPQCQFDALVCFAFNVGVSAYLTSTLRKKLLAGDIQGAAAEFIRWDHAGGAELPGLKARRIAERDLFLSA